MLIKILKSIANGTENSVPFNYVFVQLSKGFGNDASYILLSPADLVKKFP